jgi:hypothetical protein
VLLDDGARAQARRLRGLGARASRRWLQREARRGEARSEGADEVHILGLEVVEHAVKYLEQLQCAAAEQRLKPIDELCECACR